MLQALFELQWDLEERGRTPGVITQIHKGKGKPATRADSYRPITLMSAIDKCFDRILANRLTHHLESHYQLHEAQNAFCQGRDCLEHVLSLHTIAQRRREQGLDTFLFFNYLEKAYDTTWRAATLHKLAEKGVRGKFLRVLATTTNYSCHSITAIGPALSRADYIACAPASIHIRSNNIGHKARAQGLISNQGKCLILAGHALQCLPPLGFHLFLQPPP